MFDPDKPPPSTWRMAKIFCRLVVPSSLTSIISVATLTLNVILAGRLNDEVKLSAVGLGQTSTLVLFYNVALGLNASQEILTSQAFGAGNIRLVGVYLNRARFILTAAFILLALLQVFLVEDFFLLVGQDEEVAKLAAQQFLYLLPFIFFAAQFDL